MVKPNASLYELSVVLLLTFAVYCNRVDAATDVRTVNSATVTIERSPAEIKAAVVPSNYAYPVGDVRRYGALGNDTADDSTALKAALAVGAGSGGRVYIPVGTFRFSSTLIIPAFLTLEGESAEASILRKVGNFVGIELRGNDNAILTRFTLMNAEAPDQADGIRVTAGGRCRITNVNVSGQGGNGIELNNSNLATLREIRTTSNGGDGLLIRGAPGNPDTNAMTIQSIDARGNKGWGVNIDSGRANFIVGVAAESNSSGGVRINDRSNLLAVYAESNGGNQIEITDSGNAAGNTLFVQEGSVVNNGTADANTVLQNRRRTVYDSSLSKITTDRLIIPNEQANGRAVVGNLSLSHEHDRSFDLVAGGSSNDQTLTLRSTSGQARFALSADNVVVRGTTPQAGRGEVAFGATTANSAGAAGSASALPATPAGYLEMSIDGKIVEVPFYNR